MLSFAKLVARLSASKAKWAWNNKGKVVEWIKNGATFEWISNKIDQMMG
ncbi:aureocin A53 family class IId bacteriocin [Bacillus wiedmannii]|nr:aureocin A53 family class IId bacteriocin [Bacillus wiedmannii]PEJ73702.1 bacteriocin aureocin A53 [Bacillus wiedmannii]PHA29390.1 bacteriocin aureocin A53 [Bacillus wiedmannii]